MDCFALIPAFLLAIFTAATDGLTEQQQANLCAQVQQESVWTPDAVSPAGARGLTQFMRPTWGDIGKLVGCADWLLATDPRCSLAAQRRYMRALLRSGICQGTQPGERWALAFACYNAGLGWVRKERRLCAGPLHPECDPTRWTANVETTCLRSRSACHETRTYVERIKGYGARETAVIR